MKIVPGESLDKHPHRSYAYAVGFFRYKLSRKDPLMKVKKYIIAITIVLAIGFSYVGSALGCSDGKPPPDSNSVQKESPTL